MAKKPRVRVPKSAKRGEAVEIKTMMPHTMETGTRKVKGKVVPRMIVNKFECKYGGATVFSADLHPATAANPYISFYLLATKSGNVEFSWTEDSGKTTNLSQKMTVA